MHLAFQVSHHPPAAAHHVTSERGWSLWQHITIDSKFRGKYISVMPFGEKMWILTGYGTLEASACLYRCSFHSRKHSFALPLEREPLHVEQSHVDGAQHHCGETLDRSGLRRRFHPEKIAAACSLVTCVSCPSTVRGHRHREHHHQGHLSSQVLPLQLFLQGSPTQSKCVGGQRVIVALSKANAQW